MNKSVKFGLGLDVGIASIGWATVALDEKGEPYKLLNLGSRIFDKAENPKDGSSLAMQRRQFRSQRRLIRRRRHRLDRVIFLFQKIGLCTNDELNKLFQTPAPKNVYELRVDALDRKLDKQEWIRVLYSVLKHRGFKSNRKNAKSEDGLLLKAIQSNEEIIFNNGYRTVGEMLFKDPLFTNSKRNKGGSYKNCVSRISIQKELDLLFEKQREYGNEFTSDYFKESFLNIFLAQRNFDEGPGAPSCYGGNLIEKMIGYCALEKDKKRAPKASLSFALFSFWSKINNIRYFESIKCKEYSISKEQARKVLQKALIKQDLSYSDIRKILGLDESCYFKDITYTSKKSKKTKKKQQAKNNNESYLSIDGLTLVEDVLTPEKDANEQSVDTILDIEKKSKIKFFNSFISIKKAANGMLDHLNPFDPEDRKIFNRISYAFTVSKNDDGIAGYLNEIDISAEIKESLINNLDGFSQFGHISEEACEKLLPFLENGCDYTSACVEAGYVSSSDDVVGKDLLPARSSELDDIVNPVVRRSVSQLIKVVNSIIRENGKPEYINVEFARDLARSFADRREITKEQEDRKAHNEKVRKIIEETFGRARASSKDILIYKLWMEQESKCIYSGKHIDAHRLFEPGYVEVDHILPFSKSFDDSMTNKVLVFKEENQNKANRTPLEYMRASKPMYVDSYLAMVKFLYKSNFKKLQNLTTEFCGNDREEWSTSNLNDTRYIAKFIHKYIKDHLYPAKTGIKRVRAVNGRITSLLRHFWGIKKIRENGDLHHAVDAAVISVTTDMIIKKFSEASKRHEEYDEKIMVEKPWEMFVDEISARISENPADQVERLGLSTYSDEEKSSLKTPFVSRMPRHKVTGSVHDSTLRSPVLLKQGINAYVSKREINDKLLKVFDDKKCEFFNMQLDAKFYASLKSYLEDKNENKGEFHKIKKDGSLGPVVRKVKVVENCSSGVFLNNGKAFAKNGDMIRIDVFQVKEGKDKGFYFVPIYVADKVKDKLPSRAVIQGKDPKDWKEMKDEDFIYSLYPNDLIYFSSKKIVGFKNNNKSSEILGVDMSEGYLYYTGADISTASINVDFVDNSFSKHGLGVKTLKEFRKFTIDVLGNIHEVKKEKRLVFGRK